MGGDHGPAVIVEGAADAVREFGASVILVGNRDAIERELARLNAGTPGLEIRPAWQGVEMAESPSRALRRKRASSLRIAAELVRDGHASAFISAGNTGAAMAIAMFVIGVLRGIDRPAIATVLPSLKRATVLLDGGANVAPKPWHLFQFALMGHASARDILGVDKPRVGLLSVGEEEGKGNELTRETYEQLKESSLNFVGNVEGRDIYNGACDVVVTDGFTGNVAQDLREPGRDARRHDQGGADARSPVQDRRRAIDAGHHPLPQARGLHRVRRSAAARHRRRGDHLPRTVTGEGHQERRARGRGMGEEGDRKSTRLNSSHGYISYAVF